MPQEQWRWTSKGPALIAGAAMVLIGAVVMNGRWRYSLPVGILLISTGFLTAVYSTTVHQWCAPTGAAAFGQQWGSGFYHGPSAWDCWHLVNPSTPRGR